MTGSKLRHFCASVILIDPETKKILLVHHKKFGKWVQPGGHIEEEETTETESQEESNVPREYISALRKAESYSETLHMSKQGIYDQLTSEYGEKFTPEAAQYAIDHMNADWNANALEQAKSYQETLNMSPQAIYDQLISEYGGQFTPEEAQYAIDHLN